MTKQNVKFAGLVAAVLAGGIFMALGAHRELAAVVWDGFHAVAAWWAE
jgi:hypothetical protein